MKTNDKTQITVYLAADLHRAVKAKAALSSATVSDLVEEAVKDWLDGCEDDAAAVRAARDEPSYSLEEVLAELA